MSILISIKKSIASLLHLSGTTQTRLKSHSRGGFVVLMYHRVLRHDSISDTIQPGMYVNVRTFENQVVFLGKYFRVLPLNELTNSLVSNQKQTEDRPQCAITFDDGWVDFYENVYPLLKKYKLPATVFLPTSYIGTIKRFWTNRLAEILKRNNSNKGTTSGFPMDPFADKIVGLKTSQADRYEKAINLLKSLPHERIDRILTDLVSIWGTSFNPISRAFISWEEAKEMYESGLVTFGSHTADHKILTLCNDEETVYELKSSKEKLLSEGIVNEDFIPFCYPNGNFDERIVNLVNEAGYQIAVTTESGWNSWNSPTLSLRRVGIHQDMTSTDAMFGCRIAGIL